MKGQFKYIDYDGNIQEVFDTNMIPSDARDVVFFKVDPPEPPHSQEDHQMIEMIAREFEIVRQRVYGA